MIGFSIVGFGLLWWAGEQLEAIYLISSRTFQVLEWRILGWIVTLVAVGAAFSIAASAARTGESRARVVPTLVVAALPIVVIIYYWGAVAFGLTQGWGIWYWILSDSAPIVASSVIAGFLFAGLATSRLNWSD